ncbi:MAG: DUF6064 family protein, partial [Telluria sp.]
TYSLSDFLMFSARSYFRQFELVNRDLWPLQLPALAAGAALVACILRARPAGSRIAFALLSLAWLAVAWAYHLARYADISTGAPYFAAGFGVQAGLLAWMAGKPRPALPAGKVALLIVLLALAIYPLLAPLDVRSWWQAEVFALAPDPTVAATFGVLLFWHAPWPLWVIPLAWSAASSATLFELGAAQAWLLPAVALASVIASRAQQVPRPE